jgi:hypothetical protein
VGEDGLAGISDDKQLLCFSVALWNGKHGLDFSNVGSMSSLRAFAILPRSDFHNFSRARGPKGPGTERKNRSIKSADGRMATEAARLERKEEEKTYLTHTGLLMEGVSLHPRSS